MTATELLNRIRDAGGKVEINSKGKVAACGVPTELKGLLRRYGGAVKAVLREERAARAWEASGHDPGWWRTYQSDAPIEVEIPCTCDEKPYPHGHHGSE